MTGKKGESRNDKKIAEAKEKNSKKQNRKDIEHTEQTWEWDKIISEYSTNLERGLTLQQVLANREKYGLNQLTPPKKRNEFLAFIDQFNNFFMIILLAGAVIIFIGYGVEQSLNQADTSLLFLGLILIVVVAIAGGFAYIMEAQAAKTMEGFKNMTPKKCRAKRENVIDELDAKELVPGDVVILADGDSVPADVRIISCTDLKVDNASLTGESEAVERYPHLQQDAQGNKITNPLEAANLCFFSTIVSEGNGVGVVIHTGDDTAIGQIANLTINAGDNELAPITIEINAFIHNIAAFALCVGAIFCVIHGAFFHWWVQAVVVGVSLVIGIAPEALLVTFTVALAVTAKRMAAKQVLVKKLQAVETLGSTNVIASDKTGTLTQNRMTVQHAWYDFNIFSVPAGRNKEHYNILANTLRQKENVFNESDPTFKILNYAIVLNNNANFRPIFDDDTGEMKDIKNEMKKPTFNVLGLETTGDASESGLIKFAQIQQDITEAREASPKLFEIKFNSVNKWQLSIHKIDGFNCPILLLKGAPERVLKMCDKIMNNGEEIPMGPEEEKQFTLAYETLGGMGERVLGFSYAKLEGYDMDYEFTNKPQPNFPLNNLTFVGLTSMIDPAKEGVPEAIQICKQAMIKVFMVTGDHPITALAIAKKVGIIEQEAWEKNQATVIKGDDLRRWMELPNNQHEVILKQQFMKYRQMVFARVSPTHKLVIVENIKKVGDRVAVTGDGVNDAPALKMANIGVAMNISGKDVTKEAADMVLLDDNFASIVNGIEQGRILFDNIRKSVEYIMTSKDSEFLAYFIWIAGRLPLSLSAILILLIDVFCDIFPAVAMSQELKESDIMKRPPRLPTDVVVTRKVMISTFLILGPMHMLAAYLAFFSAMNDYGFPPWVLWGVGYTFSPAVTKGIDSYPPLICNTNELGQALYCGYGCPMYDYSPGQNRSAWVEMNQCRLGCPMPTPGFNDPFIEMTSNGFRGFDGTYQSACARSCCWYFDVRDNAPATYNRWLQASRSGKGSEQYLLTDVDVFQFEQYCASAGPICAGLKQNTDYVWNKQLRLNSPQYKYLETIPQADITTAGLNLYKFRGEDFYLFEWQKRGRPGGYYWWNANIQFFANGNNQEEVLRFSQTAYFANVVSTRLITILLSKTRKESFLEHGIGNMILNYAMFAEVAIMILLVYVPAFNIVFQTRQLYALHWFVGTGFAVFIFWYEEVRKMIARNMGNDSWFDRILCW